MIMASEDEDAFVESPKLCNSSLVCLIGASSSGKSSFLAKFLKEGSAHFENGISSECN